MKKLLAGLLLLCGTAYGAQPESSMIVDLSGGVYNAEDPTRIPDNCVYEARNVLFDDGTLLSTRAGMKKLNSTAIGDGEPVVGMAEYKMSDGSVYQIAQSSNSLYYRQSGPKFTRFETGLDDTYPCNFTVFMDSLCYCNGVDDLKYWDTSSTQTHTTDYQPRYLTAWQNRLCISGDDDEPSKVRISAALDPSDFTIGGTTATAGTVIDINSQDGQKVMGFFLSPNGNLGVLKEKSVWEIGGHDKDDFYLRFAIPDIGCSDSGSIASRWGMVTWLSEQGIVGYDGNTYKIISDNIQDDIDNIKQTIPGTGAFVKYTSEDWSIYLSSQSMSITNELTPDDVYDYYDLELRRNKPAQLLIDSTGYYHIIGQGDADSQVKEFIFNPLNNTVISTNTIDASSLIVLDKKLHSYAVIDDTGNRHCVYTKMVEPSKYSLFYASAAKDSNVWTRTQVSQDMNSFWGGERLVSVDIDSTGNPHILFSSYTTATDNYALMYTSYAAGVNQGIITLVTEDKTASGGVIKIDGLDNIHCAYNMFAIDDTDITYSSSTNHGLSWCHTDIYSSIGNVYGIIDLEIDSSTTVWIAHGYGASLCISSTTGSAITTTEYPSMCDNYIYYCLLSIASDDTIGVAYSDELSSQDIYYYSNASGSFIKYTITENDPASGSCGLCSEFGPHDNAIILYSLDRENDLAYMDSHYAYYTSDVYDTGFDSLYFETFNVDYSDGDDTLYNYYRSSDTAAHCLNETWTSFTANTIPSGTAARYIQYKALITSKNGTGSKSSIDLVNLNYKSTSGSQRLQSMTYDDRIWMGVSVSSAASLDRRLIYDSNSAWAEFDSAIPCVSLLNYNGTPYMGSDDGFIYTLDTGTDDDGHAINAYAITKAYDMGAIPQEKSLDSVFVTALEGGDWNLNLDYYINLSPTLTETFEIDLDETDNIINYKLPLTKRDRFYTLQYKLWNETINQPFEALGVYTIYKRYPLR